MKDERKIGKKMKETILVEGKSIVLKNVRLYVQSMAKDDLEVKRVEPKSNQSTLHVAAMTTAPAASKPAVVVEKSSRRYQKPLRIWVAKPKWLYTIRMFD